MFLDIKFPENISYSSVGGVYFATNIISTTAGFEARKNIGNKYGRCKFDISKGIKTQAEIDELISFFRITCGMQNSFRFKDQNDFRAEKQTLNRLSEDMKTFRFVKIYKFHNTEIMRPITKPIEGTVVFFNTTSDYNIDYSTGIVSFTEKQLNNPIASFQFDIEARFNTACLNISLNNFGAKEQSAIEIIEV